MPTKSKESSTKAKSKTSAKKAEEVSVLRFRIKLKAYDHKLIDNSVKQIIEIAREKDGPISLDDITRTTNNGRRTVLNSLRELVAERELIRIEKGKGNDPEFLLNDDFSTMDFVIDVLVKVFRKSIDEASVIMLNIHNNGRELCGVYSHEIALTKVAQVKAMAREQGFPLKAVMEEE